jgi:hypothetical protein
MFAHLRFFVSVLVILTGVSASPAYSNPIADLSNSKGAIERVVAPAVPQETCLLRPGQSAVAGKRWVYHREGHRKCWFPTTEPAQLKKRVRYRPAKASVAASAESQNMQPKPESIDDARAELLPAVPEIPQALPSASGFDVVAAGSVLSAERASPLAAELNRLEPDNRAEPRLDTDTDLRRASPPKSTRHAALVGAAAPVHPASQALDDKLGWPATWIAMLLMTLGFISILSSNRAIRDIVMLRKRYQSDRPGWWRRSPTVHYVRAIND